eukprot:TRINITY_DN3608_c0_g1_i1.p1 TRINITY_DN3608_c0_g1~~TRINITY_DN3608_c0_g1_i1.p1  ORF type:complete len:155 (+),score=26.80 TRINITY_DN3608_c0_g1_i1:38-502(+)
MNQPQIIQNVGRQSARQNPGIASQSRMPASSIKPTPNMHTNPSGSEERHVIRRDKLQELVQQIDPTERLDSEAEDLLLLVADEFVESVTEFACKLAKHRNSNSLDPIDLQLHLEKAWNIKIPGFTNEANITQSKKPGVPASHQQRLQAIKKTKK